jgi:TetR/AcrR family transcriptional regulator
VTVPLQLSRLPVADGAQLGCVIETMRDDNDDPLDRRNRILGGARAAFLRFGFERASMADIAVGAGVSRTALYHYFVGKEEVLRAVVEELHAGSLSAAAEALEKSQTLDAALTGLLEARFGRTLAVITESPHGVELVDATHRLTGPATRAADVAFHALVVKALVRHGRVEEVEAVADTLIAAAKGLMRYGEVHVSKAGFEERIHRLVAWITN